jgi:acetylornithine/succinyldiaminopimelate/putrescine aminotransferase
VAATRGIDVRRSGAPYIVRDVEETPELDLTRAGGSPLFAKQGKRYIDFAAGWSGGNLGSDRQELRQAVHSFEGPDGVNPFWRYSRWGELASGLPAIGRELSTASLPPVAR